MRTPSTPLALACVLVLAATAAFAQTATPGTSTPHSSGEWGKDEATLRLKVNELFARLLAQAHKGIQVGGTKISYSGTPIFKVDLGHQVIGGSPAAAFQAGIGQNKTGPFSGNDLVYAGSALFEMVDPKEASMFLAHEIGHLVYRHPKAMEEKKMALVDKLYGEWEATHQAEIQRINAIPGLSDAQRADATVKQFFKDSSAKLQSELAPLQQPMEDDADKYGRALALQTDPTAGDATVTSFQRAQDWLWALKLEMADANHAGTVADRAAKNAKWLADERAASERSATATRRSKAAASGMSVP